MGDNNNNESNDGDNGESNGEHTCRRHMIAFSTLHMLTNTFDVHVPSTSCNFWSKPDKSGY